ncbi:MAG: hypothetical protein K8R58_07965 [Bacteroidales bacterium]|nr:hypothetical protein [Bacteroidales bacterium]
MEQKTIDKKKSIRIFKRISDAIYFYLDEAFNFADFAMVEILARAYIKKLIKENDTILNESNRIRKKKIQMTSDILELLRTEYGVLSEETNSEINKAWDLAYDKAYDKTYKFKKTFKIYAIDMLGHINFFAFFLEVFINRHLHFLQLGGKIDEFSYNKLIERQIFDKLIYIFKDEIN